MHNIHWLFWSCLKVNVKAVKTRSNSILICPTGNRHIIHIYWLLVRSDSHTFPQNIPCHPLKFSRMDCLRCDAKTLRHWPAGSDAKYYRGGWHLLIKTMFCATLGLWELVAWIMWIRLTQCAMFEIWGGFLSIWIQTPASDGGIKLFPALTPTHWSVIIIPGLYIC